MRGDRLQGRSGGRSNPGTSSQGPLHVGRVAGACYHGQAETGRYHQTSWDRGQESCFGCADERRRYKLTSEGFAAACKCSVEHTVTYAKACFLVDNTSISPLVFRSHAQTRQFDIRHGYLPGYTSGERALYRTCTLIIGLNELRCGVVRRRVLGDCH